MAKLKSLLDSLQPARAGLNIRDILTSGWVSTIQQIVICLARGENLVTGPGLRKKEIEAGFILEAKRGRGGSSGGECTQWAPSLAGTALTLKPGTINGLVPSNIFSTFTIPASSTRYLVATCLTDGSQINAISLAVSSSPPTPAAATPGGAPLSFDVLVTLVHGGVAYKMVSCHPFYHPREVLREDKASPTPGTLPYVSYYAWELNEL